VLASLIRTRPTSASATSWCWACAPTSCFEVDDDSAKSVDLDHANASQ